ncbi:MAG: VacJ family lipoprotein [Pseudomonadota bacterium]
MLRALTLGLMLTTALGACTSTPSSQDEGVYDPFEPLNRQVFAFNEAADKAVIGPTASAYETVTPQFFRTGVSNFLSNLSSPVVFANDVLQGEPKRAGDTLFRFLVNSTFGVGGIMDPAEHELGRPGHNEDFGQTLGVWGVPEGPFLVLPLLGPSNLRDGLGRGVDAAFDPLNYEAVVGDDDTRTTIAVSRGVLGALNARVALDPALQQLREQPEPYIALRRTYTAQRKAEIRNGQEEADPYTDLPDFDDFE